MFKKKNIQTLVIDLRDNGGGYLTAATDILDLFFTSDEVIYQMKEKNSAAKKYYAESDKKYEFENDMKRSEELTLEKYQNRSRIVKIKESLSRLFSDVL